MDGHRHAPSIRVFELRVTADLVVKKKSEFLQDSDQFSYLDDRKLRYI
ncbi:MAG: hypothetical protein WC659_02620 [Patescibacteria group bacterium]